MRSKKVYFSRKWLTDDTDHYVFGEIYESTRYDDSSKTFVDAQISLGDCHRSVMFDFSCYGMEEEEKKKLAKRARLLREEVGRFLGRVIVLLEEDET